MDKMLAMVLVSGVSYYTLTFALFNWKRKNRHAAIGIAVFAILTWGLSFFGLYLKPF
ncbi:MAG: hypothetical protein ACM3WV_00455 [Bacillota bacterium]